MYLHDLIVVARSYEEASNQFQIVRELLKELGLPEAQDKTQPPTQRLRWLGVEIDVAAGTLTIPDDKLEDVLHSVSRAMKKRSISRKQLQSILVNSFILVIVLDRRAFFYRDSWKDCMEPQGST